MVTIDCGNDVVAIEFEFEASTFSGSGWRTSVISRGMSDQSFSLFKEPISIVLFLEHASSSFDNVLYSEDNDARRLSGETLRSMDRLKVLLNSHSACSLGCSSDGGDCSRLQGS